MDGGVQVKKHTESWNWLQRSEGNTIMSD